MIFALHALMGTTPSASWRSNMNHKKHPDTVVPPHRAGEIHGKIIYRNESYKIQGAIFEVYKILGPGFLEAVYQECLEKELALRNIPFRSQVDIRLCYA